MNIPVDIFNNVYSDNYTKLLRFAKSILHDNHRAEESVQEAFTKLLKQDYDKVKTHINQWLFTVCRNDSIKILNKNKRYVEALENDSIDGSRDPSEELEFQEKIKILKKCMRKLSPRQREVLKFRFFKDLNYEQSAKKMKTSSSNIGFLQCTTLKELRIIMNKEINK